MFFFGCHSSHYYSIISLPQFFSTINCRVNSFVRSIWGSGTPVGYRYVNHWNHPLAPLTGTTHSLSHPIRWHRFPFDSQCQRPSTVDRLNDLPKGERRSGWIFWGPGLQWVNVTPRRRRSHSPLAKLTNCWLTQSSQRKKSIIIYPKKGRVSKELMAFLGKSWDGKPYAQEKKYYFVRKY